MSEYKRSVDEWEKITGLKVLGGWYESTGKLAQAVKFVLDGGLKIDYDIDGLVTHAESIMRRVKEAKEISKSVEKIEIKQ